MSNWGAKSRLYLLSAVMKHGTEDWNVVNDVINTHLSNTTLKSVLTADMCQVEYQSLVSGHTHVPTSSVDLSMQEKLVSELKRLRLEEIETRIAVCKQRYLCVYEDKQLIETGRLKEHNADILSEMEKRGSEFDLKSFCEERGIPANTDKDNKSSSKNKSKSKSASKNRTVTGTYVTVQPVMRIFSLDTFRYVPTLVLAFRRAYRL